MNRIFAFLNIYCLAINFLQLQFPQYSPQTNPWIEFSESARHLIILNLSWSIVHIVEVKFLFPKQ